MLGIDARVWIDLKGIVIVSGVFEETVERVEHFMGQQEKELAATGSAVLLHKQNRLTEKDHHSLGHLRRRT
jgi:hypothetical protein